MSYRPSAIMHFTIHSQCLMVHRDDVSTVTGGARFFEQLTAACWRHQRGAHFTIGMQILAVRQRTNCFATNRFAWNRIALRFDCRLLIHLYDTGSSSDRIRVGRQFVIIGNSRERVFPSIKLSPQITRSFSRCLGFGFACHRLIDG